MKVLFVLLEIGSTVRVMPGIGQLSACLKIAGHQTDLVELDKYSTARVVNKITSWHPDLLAVSVNTHMFPYAKKLIAFLKKRYKVLPIYVGGIHFKLNPDSFAEIEADGVCIGDGDNQFVALVEAIAKKQDFLTLGNFWFKKGREIIKNPITDLVMDLDSLPIPDYSIFSHFKNNQQVVPNFMFSRGCPFNCTYCCNSVLAKQFTPVSKYVRTLSVDRALTIIGYYDKHYSFDNFEIDDDTFSLNKKWVLEFCQKYQKQFKQRFICNIRVETADREILQALKEAGCEVIWVGVETGNEQLRRQVLGRFMTNDQIITVFDLAHSLNLKTGSFNMLGIPGETKETIRQTIELNVRLKPDQVQVTFFYPYQKTKLYDQCLRAGYLRKTTLTNYFSGSILKLPTVGNRDLIKAEKYFRFNVYKHYSWLKALTSWPYYRKLRFRFK